MKGVKAMCREKNQMIDTIDRLYNDKQYKDEELQSVNNELHRVQLKAKDAE